MNLLTKIGMAQGRKLAEEDLCYRSQQRKTKTLSVSQGAYNYVTAIMTMYEWF